MEKKTKILIGEPRSHHEFWNGSFLVKLERLDGGYRWLRLRTLGCVEVPNPDAEALWADHGVLRHTPDVLSCALCSLNEPAHCCRAQMFTCETVENCDGTLNLCQVADCALAGKRRRDMWKKDPGDAKWWRVADPADLGGARKLDAYPLCYWEEVDPLHVDLLLAAEDSGDIVAREGIEAALETLDSVWRMRDDMEMTTALSPSFYDWWTDVLMNHMESKNPWDSEVSLRDRELLTSFEAMMRVKVRNTKIRVRERSDFCSA